MGRNRKKTGAGAVEATRYDVFGNVLPETPAAQPSASSPVIKALGERASQLITDGNGTLLPSVLTEAQQSGIDAIPFTTPDGRSFTLQQNPRGFTEVVLSPESQSELDAFTGNRQNIRQTLEASTSGYYVTAVHPAAYYLAEAQAEYMRNPSVENESRMNRLQFQFDSVRGQLSAFDAMMRRYAAAGGRVPLPESIVRAQASNTVLQGNSIPIPFVDTFRPIQTASDFKKAQTSLRNTHAALIRNRERWASLLTNDQTPTAQLQSEVYKYEEKRLLRNVNRLQTQIDTAVRRIPRPFSSKVTDEDRANAQFRNQFFDTTHHAIDTI
jgi:hypothetical protein